jgi:hypothetical protein
MRETEESIPVYIKSDAEKVSEYKHHEPYSDH